MDDEPSRWNCLRPYLAERGYDVSCAVDGGECVRKLASFKPQVLVLDIRPRTPTVSIYSKETERGKRTPPHIIIITAFHDMGTTIKAMKLGAFEYIPKPIDVDDLEAAIKRAVDLSRTRTSGFSFTIGPAQKIEERDIIGRTRK